MVMLALGRNKEIWVIMNDSVVGGKKVVAGPPATSHKQQPQRPWILAVLYIDSVPSNPSRIPAGVPKRVA